MIHRRIKHMFALVVLALLLPFAPAQAAQAAVVPTLVKDINPGAGSSSASNFVAMNSTLFFLADDGVHGHGLWSSDGTAAGTALLKATTPGRYYSTQPAAVVGNFFYFGDIDSYPYSLWKSDGTVAGTSKVADVGVEINTLSMSGIAFQGKLFFAASNYSLSDLMSPLWSSDGTTAGTVPIAFAGFEHQRITHMFVVGGTLYYTTADRREDEDGDPITGPALYRSDGTVAGTQKLLQITAGSAKIADLTSNGSKLFFSVDDYKFLTQGALWMSDGTVVGTVPLADATGKLVYRAAELFDFNGVIVFYGSVSDEDYELWRSDGTPTGTYRIKDIRPGPIGSLPNDFVVLNSLIYFIATDAASESELWRSDGTEAGTFQVTHINQGRYDYPNSLTAFNGALYFVNSSADGKQALLWTSDGTAVGTVQLVDPATSQPLQGATFNHEFSVLNATLFFPANDGRTGVELWKLAEVTGRVTTGLQARYNFNEGTGSVVHDVAGVGSPLDLTIKKSSQVHWGAGSLEITGFTPIASNGPATKLIDAAKASDAVTVEAWVTPANVTQYSARILTISPKATVRNLTVTQGLFTQNDATLASLRLRTTATASNGKEVLSPSGIMQPALIHLVCTSAADGALRIYVNGVQVAQAKISGTLDNWNATYPLILANEQSGGRGWRGTYHLVAIYDRALSAAEVGQNYAAGAEAP